MIKHNKQGYHHGIEELLIDQAKKEGFEIGMKEGFEEGMAEGMEEHKRNRPKNEK